MQSFNSFLQNVFSFIKTLTKKAYRNYALVATGTVVLAVVSFSSNAFGGGGKNNVSVVNSEQDTSASAENTDETDDETAIAELANAEVIKVLAADSHKLETEADSETATEQPVTETETETEAKQASAIVSYSQNDYDNLLRIVESEATGCDMKGKILVANVVINRVKNGSFPGTITDVIFQGNGEQFQPVMDGRFYSVQISQTTIEAVNRALIGEDYSQGALFFASVQCVTQGGWHSTHLTRLFEYGGHVFFTY